MAKLYEVKTDWVKLDRTVDNLAKHKGLIRPFASTPYIENATDPIKNLGTPGFDSTAHDNVFLVKVGRHDYPLQNNEEYDIRVKHDEKLEGAWGSTRSIAYLKYVLSEDDTNLPCSVRLMGVAYAALIRMKPLSEYGKIGDFEPIYARLDTDFGGNVQTLSRVLAIDTDDSYREFGTFEGVLFHELLHFKLAQIDGAIRYESTRESLRNNTFSDAAAALKALRDMVKQEWEGWRGWITAVASYNDHRYIWEEECKYYVRQYRKTI